MWDERSGSHTAPAFSCREIVSGNQMSGIPLLSWDPDTLIGSVAKVSRRLDAASRRSLPYPRITSTFTPTSALLQA